VGFCVGCTNNGQCPDPSRGVCSSDTHNCVQCTPGITAACMPSGNGGACLTPADVCGCLKDSDCGGPNSGRVCDTVTHHCEAGCSKIAGGNSCIAGPGTCNTCNAADGELGQCVSMLCPGPDIAGGGQDASVGPTTPSLAGGGLACSTGAGHGSPLEAAATLALVLAALALGTRRSRKDD
jgi:MYXO-CTERM domain-containing protein